VPSLQVPNNLPSVERLCLRFSIYAFPEASSALLVASKLLDTSGVQTTASVTRVFKKSSTWSAAPLSLTLRLASKGTDPRLWVQKVVGSTIARRSDGVSGPHDGPEGSGTWTAPPDPGTRIR
jgi:hypothetical protein